MVGGFELVLFPQKSLHALGETLLEFEIDGGKPL